MSTIKIIPIISGIVAVSQQSLTPITVKISEQSVTPTMVSVNTNTQSGTNDHGSLSGLVDDDHLQYVHIDNARTINAIHNFASGLGINTSSPSGALHIVNDDIACYIGDFNTATNGGKVRIFMDDNDAQNQGIKSFISKVGSSGNYYYGINGTSYTIAGSGLGTNVGLYGYAGNGTRNWGLWIQAGDAIFNDKVGIGTQSPSYTLDVVGSGNFSHGLYISGVPVSVSGHSHTSSNIIDFDSSVSGLLPVKNILAGSGINIVDNTGVYTISSTNDSLLISSNGRLTLQSGDPAYYNDISGSTLYFTPYLGNQIGLYDIINNKWKSFSFTEISLSLSSMINNTNYDIFLFDNSGILTLERVAWTNNSTRSVSLVYQDGVLVRTGSINKRYIGTIRSTSTTTTEDSISRRFVYNHNNQITKPLNISDSVSHTYSTSSPRPYRNITTVGATRAELVAGQNIFTNIICTSYFTTQSNSSSVGVSVDSTGVFNTKALNTTTITSGALASTISDNSIDNVGVGAGYHYIQLLESGSSISTFNSASFRVVLLC